jgi:hypothetical protein
MIAEEPYDLIRRKLPGAWRFIEENLDESLLDISRRLRSSAPPPSATLLAAVERKTQRLIGGRAAADLRLSLMTGAGASAASHHGVESYPEMVQGNLMFGLEEIGLAMSGKPFAPILVLACENVPLASATCPGGFLFGRRRNGDRLERVHLFKRSSDSLIAGRAPALGLKDLNRFIAEIWRSELRPWEKNGLAKIIEPLTADDSFLGAPDFQTQASLLNRGLWDMRFKCRAAPTLAFLSLEGLASDCLLEDLARSDSLAYQLIEDRQALAKILSRLCGVSGCWGQALLDDPAAELLKDRSRPLGTVLFWEVSPLGRAAPMGLSAGGEGLALFGPRLRLPLRPKDLRDALAAKEIMPGLFLSFATLGLGHGLRTYGGVYMADYLPRMFRTLKEARLLNEETDLSWAGGMTAGPLPIRFDSGLPGVDGLFPAGAVELAAAGPFGDDFFHDLGRLKLSDIWIFSASEWYIEETRPQGRIEGWADAVGKMRSVGDGLRLWLA